MSHFFSYKKNLPPGDVPCDGSCGFYFSILFTASGPLIPHFPQSVTDNNYKLDANIIGKWLRYCVNLNHNGHESYKHLKYV